jgi:hypothetical protein
MQDKCNSAQQNKVELNHTQPANKVLELVDEKSPLLSK